MAELRLYFFGAPRIERDGLPVPLRRARATALLAYLVLSRQPQERERLLALLWPEFDTASARNNLRRELSLLRATLGDEVLRTSGSQVAWNDQAGAWVDVAVFQAEVAAGLGAGAAPLSVAAASALEHAARLAGNEFMAGFSLTDCPDFDEWQFFQREELRQQLARALPALSAWHGAQGAYDAALGYTRRWLALDPLHEPAHRELMRLYAMAGQHAAALRQYEDCARLLAAELGGAPEAETQALFAAVKGRRIGPPAANVPPFVAPAPPAPGTATTPAPAVAPPAPRVLSELPPLSAGFVGRAREVADIVRRLTDPDCRLLTLVGPGGAGKTQLALRVAHTLRDELVDSPLIADGVAFVPLLPIATPDGVVVALAAALQLELQPGLPAREQLFARVRARRMLLVLDNFEHLADAAALVTDLLAAGPGLRLLVTSRVALNIPAEWFHPVDGLSTPPPETSDVAALARYDAVRFFEQLARRARGDFQLSGALDPVVRLCRLVAGMPLALELAAGWLKTLTVAQVVAAIERDPATLSSRDRTLPDRHRNMRIVFDETWRRLAPDEQAALVGLTVFVGEFTSEAAQVVTGAGLDVLAALVDQSLVRATATGRMWLHELLRQLAARQLPDVAQAAYERHSTYYLTLLADHEGLLTQRGWKAGLDTLGSEPGNLRAAWLRALAQGRLDLVDRALSSMAAIFMGRCDYQECEVLFGRAAGIAGSGELERRVAARALIHHAAVRYHLGDNPGAVARITSGLELADGLGIEQDRANAYMLLGRIAGWEGDEQTARRRVETALEIARAAGEERLVAQMLPDLSWICSSFGDFTEGRRLADEGLRRSDAFGRPELSARALRMLGWAESCSGAYAEAERHYSESLALAERLGSRHGIAASLNGLGWSIWCGGARLDEARARHLRSLDVLRALGNEVWVSNVLGDLALVELDTGAVDAARAIGAEGLSLATKFGSKMFRAYHLGILGRVATLAGEHAAGRAHLRDALSDALATRLWPKVGFVLFQIALLRLAEADAGGDDQGRADAVELLAAVAGHPATWYVYRARAERLLDDLGARLPAELAGPAVARGRALDWGTDLGRLREALQ